MTEDELKKLKEEIKHELINELTRKDYVKDNTWKTLKCEFKKMFYSKGYRDNMELNNIFTSISTTLRIVLGYRGVEMIPVEKYDEAKKIMFTIFNLYPKKKGDE